jgi:catechol 2,3-dioxygenase-like lactoylglutathione lyase family enzyme
MLRDVKIGVVLAVKDLVKAREFYGGKLGFDEVPNNDPGGVLYKSGDSTFYVYESQFAGSNQATAASWMVDGIEPVIQDLKAKGVTFEHYDDMPGVKREDDLHVMDNMKAAWFKDPDGNILNITSGMQP